VIRINDGSLNIGIDGSFNEKRNSALYGLQLPDRVLFNGLQPIIKNVLSVPVTMADLEEAEEYFNGHGPTWNKQGWLDLIEKYDGKLPIRIKAVPEGSIVPLSNVLVTLESLDAEFNWLLGYLETMIMRVWFPISVATQSWLIKQDLIRYLEKTSDEDMSSLMFKLHDFGSRGVSSRESAAIGGAAHLINFRGTDTLVALPYIRNNYGIEGNVAGFSVNAAEHSTVLPWGKDNESDAYRHIMNVFKGEVVSIVSDSYDHWNAVENIFGDELKDMVVNNGATVVVRPDSGDPTVVVVRTIELLMKQFGFTLNSKGYRVLPPYIRVIQGDGIERRSINSILTAMELNTMSIDNIVFGMGGALLQKVNRDTFGFAIKPSAVERNGVWEGVSKNPVDMGSKKSKAGRLDLIKENGKYKTIVEGQLRETLLGELSKVNDSELVTVFEMGEVGKTYSYEEVRERSDLA
jgi:nicotinamide phosphoribosyltransferase